MYFIIFYCITVADHENIGKRSTDNRKPILPVNGKQREREKERDVHHKKNMNEGLIGYIFEINVVHWLI